MKRLLKFWSLPHREKDFFCEAAILLLLSNLCVRTVAFRYIENFLSARYQNSGPYCDDHADEIKLIKIALERAANLFPWESLCLSRSIAAFIMLRRRGIPAVFCAGVKFLDDSSMSAHAWVWAGQAAIEGDSENSTFTVVLRIGQ